MGRKNIKQEIVKICRRKKGYNEALIEEENELNRILFRHNTFSRNIIKDNILGKKLEDAQELHASTISSNSWILVTFYLQLKNVANDRDICMVIMIRCNLEMMMNPIKSAM